MAWIPHSSDVYKPPNVTLGWTHTSSIFVVSPAKVCAHTMHEGTAKKNTTTVQHTFYNLKSSFSFFLHIGRHTFYGGQSI